MLLFFKKFYVFLYEYDTSDPLSAAVFNSAEIDNLHFTAHCL
jgi:hypothetical protein